MSLVAGGLQSGGGTASQLGPGATGSTLTLTGASTALQFVSTQASGSDAFKVNTSGARWHVGAGANDYFSSNGTTITFAGPIATASNITIARDISASGGAADYITTAGGVSMATNKALYLNGATQTRYIYSDGTNIFVGGGTISYVEYTDDSGTPGNRTVNKARGKNAFAIAASTCVITNSFVTTSSQIICTLEFVDVTLTQILTVIPAAGSFTVTGNAVAAAATKFSWIVIA